MAAKMEEKKGQKCPKCQTLYLGNEEQCTKCGTKTESATLYAFERINRERWVFIALFSLIIGLITFFISMKLDACGIAFLISFIVLSSAFHTGNYLFGGLGGGFKDRFLKEQNHLEESELHFNWPKVFKDFLIFLVILVIGVIIAGIVRLIKS